MVGATVGDEVGKGVAVASAVGTTVGDRVGRGVVVTEDGNCVGRLVGMPTVGMAEGGSPG